MKKLIITISLLFCLAVSSHANNLPENVKDANTLQIHMRKNFYYAHDRVPSKYDEYFQLPAVLEFTRIGDCDDFAIYSTYYLYQMNYKVFPYVILLEVNGEIVGHAITVFYDKADKTYSIFSNQYIFKTLETNPIEAIKDVYENWVIIYEWKFSKVGYLTFDEVYADCEPVDFVDLQTMMAYYINKLKESIFDYVD